MTGKDRDSPLLLYLGPHNFSSLNVALGKVEGDVTLVVPSRRDNLQNVFYLPFSFHLDLDMAPKYLNAS